MNEKLIQVTKSFYDKGKEACLTVMGHVIPTALCNSCLRLPLSPVVSWFREIKRKKKVICIREERLDEELGQR